MKKINLNKESIAASYKLATNFLGKKTFFNG